MALKTDYKDDILNAEVNENRKYRMITNDDGTVSFEDVTGYLQVGDSFGAQEINQINSDLANKGVYVGDLNNVPMLKVNNICFYYCDRGDCSNLPDNNSGVLKDVHYEASYATQEYTTLQGIKYTRSLMGGTWSDWVKLALNSDLAQQVLTFTNKTVATSAWTESTDEDFPYYADVTCSGVTTSYVPTVNFSLADANSGIFSTVCESRSGAVRIYASEKPTATVTIPTIQCIKSV